MICPACGNENPTGSAFCEECGANLHAACPACGSEVSPGARFCRSCGTALNAPPPVSAPRGRPSDPTAFCDGRYQVERFLGEGGKKRVYLAHDTKLDRDVAFALIKTEGLDEASLVRIRREAQAMGRLGDHPHIVSVYDIGDVGAGDWVLGVGDSRLSPTSNTQSLSPKTQPYIVTQLMVGGDVEALIAGAEGHRSPSTGRSGSPSTSARRWSMRTPTGSFTGISSPATCGSPPMGRPSWATSGSPSRWIGPA